MKKMKFRTHLGLLLLIVMVLVAVTTFVAGKYATTISMPNTATFTAKLAESIVVQESLAVRQSDGTYVLDQTNIVPSNRYALIPGLDIPKDTHIAISGKTDVPADLYLTVADNTNETLSFELCDHWVLVEGNTYVYSDANQQRILITEDIDKVYILKDNTIYVSQDILSMATNYIRFSAKLEEPTN